MGVALCLVALALGVTERLLEPPPGVTETNLRRLRKGMTLREGEAVFGRPADEQGTGVNVADLRRKPFGGNRLYGYSMRRRGCLPFWLPQENHGLRRKALARTV